MTDRSRIQAGVITVTAAILEKDGRILAARRGAGKHLAGYWEFPGGKLEANETPQQCLARELAEEFGISVAIGDFVAESTYDYGHKEIRLLAYLATHLSGEFKPADHDQIQWLLPQQLSSLKWAPADIPLLRAVELRGIV